MGNIDHVDVNTIEEAAKNLAGVIKQTPLELNKRLSDKYQAKIYLKREDLQEVRSYKIRGAYNLISSLTDEEKSRGVVTASAGNHAQGVALSCSLLKIRGIIFMPVTTPLQKINKVKHFGGEFMEIKLTGQNFDQTSQEAKLYCEQTHSIYIPPFDDYRVIAGQGTVGKEVYDELEGTLDYCLCPIGGGGLVSGVGTYLKEKNKQIHIIGCEPTGAAGMEASIKKGEVITLDTVDTFVDGAAVKTVGQKTFSIASKITNKIILVPEGKDCTTMIELYQNEGIIAEPAGALSISALDEIANDIKDKVVVCILSGGNNDILRYPEIMEKSLVYLGLKHYFLIEFAQKPGQLKTFVNQVLGPNDDIVRFEYIKKNSKEMGPALVGIELSNKDDLTPFLERLDQSGIQYTRITGSDLLYNYLV